MIAQFGLTYVGSRINLEIIAKSFTVFLLVLLT